MIVICKDNKKILFFLVKQMNPNLTPNSFQTSFKSQGNDTENHTKKPKIVKELADISIFTRHSARSKYDVHEKVKSIPQSFLFFSPILHSEPILGADTHKLVYREELQTLSDFFSSKSGNDKVLYFISMFRHLIIGLDLLIQHEITHVNYSSIGFLPNETPVFYDFDDIRYKPMNVPEKYAPLELHIFEHSMLIAGHKRSITSRMRLSDSMIRSCIKRFFKAQNQTSQVFKRDEDLLAEEFSFLINKPCSFILELLEKNTEKRMVFGLGCALSEIVSQDGFELIPDKLIFLINRCKLASLKHRPSFQDILMELDRFG